MEVRTTRFGTLAVEPEDELLFAAGLIGLEQCRRWIVLTDTSNAALGWLQSIEQPHVALGVVSPRRFVPTYQLRVDAADLETLQLKTARDAEVVVIASRQAVGDLAGQFTLNLRAPLVVNVQQRRGCQVISKDDLPVQFPLTMPAIPSLPTAPLKRTA